MKNMIHVDELTKRFGELTAVNAVSFDVKEGEIYGFLGPNGAGKSTTINMLATLLKPTSGTATINNHDIIHDRDGVRRSIGVVFQETALDVKLTGKENLEFHGLMYGIERKELRARVAEVLKLVDLADKKNIIVEKYSGGMKRRLEIARGLIHYPKVLFLDEPTLGLDAQTRRYIWDYIKKLNKEKNVTIILTTHYMEEADFLCDRITIIDKGDIAAVGTAKELKDVLGGDAITLELSAKVKQFVEKACTQRWVKTSTPHGKTVTLTVEKGEKRIPTLIGLADKLGINVHSVNLHKPSLEDVFLHYTGRTIREDEVNNSDITRNRRRMRMQMRRGR